MVLLHHKIMSQYVFCWSFKVRLHIYTATRYVLLHRLTVAGGFSVGIYLVPWCSCKEAFQFVVKFLCCFDSKLSIIPEPVSSKLSHVRITFKVPEVSPECFGEVKALALMMQRIFQLFRQAVEAIENTCHAHRRRAKDDIGLVADAPGIEHHVDKDRCFQHPAELVGDEALTEHEQEVELRQERPDPSPKDHKKIKHYSICQYCYQNILKISSKMIK